MKIEGRERKENDLVYNEDIHTCRREMCADAETKEGRKRNFKDVKEKDGKRYLMAYLNIRATRNEDILDQICGLVEGFGVRIGNFWGETWKFCGVKLELDGLLIVNLKGLL
jgi:hypothetical protein